MAGATYSPIAEGIEESVAADGSGGCGCGCFRRLCFGWGVGEGDGYLLKRGVIREETWLEAKLKRAQELSEAAAGPKWKNFIRRIGKICGPKKSSGQEFQYTPQSYALNFAEDGEEEEGNLLHSFSSRFAPHTLNGDYHRARPSLP